MLIGTIGGVFLGLISCRYQVVNCWLGWLDLCRSTYTVRIIVCEFSVTSFSASSTLREAWKDTIAHVPTLLLTWLASLAVGLAGLVVYWVIALLFSALDDGSGVGAGMGAIFGQLSSIPFSLLQRLISVLFTAIPALYYQRGEGVVTFSDAYSLLVARLGRYLLAGVLFTIAATVGIFLCFLPGVIGWPWQNWRSRLPHRVWPGRHSGMGHGPPRLSRLPGRPVLAIRRRWWRGSSAAERKW